MPKKFKPIPAVPFDVLIKGHEAINEDREELGPGDPSISLIRALHKEQTPDVIIAIDYRLRALAKFISAGQGKPWTYAITEENGHMVNEALFKAAARAPLFTAKTVGDVAFNPDEFIKIALEESEADGQA
ncbi:hypothetical protein GPL21_36410 [Bradyrhizobium pachyrhizi]|uniref:Uncharacterized protein n=1 Tax=Bradyrhizobium pachyrhizi TaxID=280333 RepID=A0A844SU15_9BRAD|nr:MULTISPECIES: hypothetical protein [Bradyrhizobium]MVT70553.1 hypothetical protein [Bradyrhizobium pachyrhizi]PAY03367.1 hypothetical protein CK489_39620 [Bradyrhizobium sp. UFLA03-84]